MRPIDFNDYLEKKLKPTNTFSTQVADLHENSLEAMGNYLKISQTDVKLSENENLNHKLNFGKQLIKAKERYTELNERKKRNFRKWIEQTCNISYSYANRLMQMSHLIIKYPKLCDLSVSFDELFKLKNKIKSDFSAVIWFLWEPPCFASAA